MDRKFLMGAAVGAVVGAAGAAAVAAAVGAAAPRRLRGDTVEEGAIAAVFANAVRGEPASVLKALDDYCYKLHWMMNVGDEKGAIVRDALAGLPKDAVVLEFGGYVGYSAVLIGSLLPEGGRLVSIEVSPTHAALATKIVEFAGLSGRVTVMVADVPAALTRLAPLGAVDAVFIDHAKEAYLRDLKNLEAARMLRVGTVVVADNILYPGAPDYLAYVRASPMYATKEVETHLEYSTAKDVVTVSTVVKL